MSNFFLFIEEKLSKVSKWNIMIAEKSTMVVVFVTKMLTFKENELEGPALPSGAAVPILMPTQNPNLFYHNNRSSTPNKDIMSFNNKQVEFFCSIFVERL